MTQPLVVFRLVDSVKMYNTRCIMAIKGRAVYDIKKSKFIDVNIQLYVRIDVYGRYYKLIKALRDGLATDKSLFTTIGDFPDSLVEIVTSVENRLKAKLLKRMQKGPVPVAVVEARVYFYE